MNEQSNRPDNGVYVSHAMLKARVRELEAELDRLTLERDSWKAEAEMERESNERLRAAVEAAGGLCGDCGHLRTFHTWYGSGCLHGSGTVPCQCDKFKRATQPGEGEGEQR